MDDDLAALRAELTALRAEVTALRAERQAPAVDTSEPEPAGSERRFSRRGLLAAAVAGGAGIVATQVTNAAPAAAAPGGAIVMGASNDAGTTATTITSTPSQYTPVFLAQCTNGGFGISGRSGSGWGVDARSTSGTGLAAQSSTGPAIDAYSDSGFYGIYSRAMNGVGVYGYSGGAYTGVYGISDVSGPGVRGISRYGHGVHGHSQNGVAVRAEAGTDETGISPGPGTDAVYATAVNGYGVHASGGKAPIRLVPGTTRGKPKTGSHLRGEFYVDAVGALFFCARDGSPGLWKEVTVA